MKIFTLEPRLDRYGGIFGSGRGAVRHAEGGMERFRTAKAAGRWRLLTPDGHVYWMLGVFDVDLSATRFHGHFSQRDLSLAKYGNEIVWARQAVRRLRGWGFNCLAEYASEYALPVPLYGRAGNAETMPFMAMIRPSRFSLTNRWNYAPGAVKDIVAGTDPAVYLGWRGSTTPDVFDPNFAAYAAQEAGALAHHLGHASDMVGISTDDADDIYGFGPGPEPHVARLHPHIGWLVLVTNSAQTHNPALGVRYSDIRVHAKLALRDFLQQRYTTLASLNQAWGARYTSFDSDGGWPHGLGLLDESGRSAWLGQDGTRMRGARAAVRDDLDGFLFAYAAAYFQATTTALHRAFPGFLVFGPATLNGWNGLTRAPILRAAGAALDVVQANAATDAILERTVAACGDVPLVTWTGMAANADSDLYAFPHPGAGAPQYATQQERGAVYAATLTAEFTRSVHGSCPIVGTKFWAFADSWAEKMNWGLVSLHDNAYDGVQAVRRPSRDRWGFPTGGEARDYGDSLSAIGACNRKIYRQLGEESKKVRASA
ncbi:MAG: hypothetical protein ACRD1F_01445 [Terriglobales bacterium]